MTLEEKIIELNKKEYPLVKDQRIMDLLMVVLVEKETNLNEELKQKNNELKKQTELINEYEQRLLKLEKISKIVNKILK